MRKIFLFFAVAMVSVFSAADDFDIDFDGAVLKETRDGTEIYLKKEGTEIRKTKGLVEAFLTDKTIIRKFPDGRAEYLYPDGRKLIIDRPNAIRRYISPDGTEKKISFSGKTPYADEIKSVTTQICKEPAVSVNYVSEKSDELFENDVNENGVQEKNGIKSFYEELCGSVRSYLVKNKNYKGEKIQINVSFIRYAEYGYCYMKDKNVTIEFIKGSSAPISFSFAWFDLRDSAKRLEHVKKMTEEFIKLQ